MRSGGSCIADFTTFDMRFYIWAVVPLERDNSEWINFVAIFITHFSTVVGYGYKGIVLVWKHKMLFHDQIIFFWLSSLCNDTSSLALLCQFPMSCCVSNYCAGHILVTYLPNHIWILNDRMGGRSDSSDIKNTRVKIMLNRSCDRNTGIFHFV